MATIAGLPRIMGNFVVSFDFTSHEKCKGGEMKSSKWNLLWTVPLSLSGAVVLSALAFSQVNAAQTARDLWMVSAYPDGTFQCAKWCTIIDPVCC